MSRRRRLAIAAAAVAAALVIGAFVLVLRGGYEVVEPAKLGGATTLPDWTRPCWVLEPTTAVDSFSLRCARLHGTVLWVERDDPDGDGDQHQIVLAGTRLVNVKYRHGRVTGEVSGIGTDVSVIGSVPGGGGGFISHLEFRAAD